MDVEFMQLIIPAIAGLIVGFCVGYFWGTKKSVPVKIVQDLLLLIMNFVRAVSDGKLTQDEKNILIQNISTLIQDIKNTIGSGGTAAVTNGDD